MIQQDLVPLLHQLTELEQLLRSEHPTTDSEQ